jgi:hypothetical protein
MMVRTEIELTDKQSHILTKLADKQGVSMDELIRTSIDLFINTANVTGNGSRSDEQYERAFKVAGMFSVDDADLGREHDKYLAEIYAEVGQ